MNYYIFFQCIGFSQISYLDIQDHKLYKIICNLLCTHIYLYFSNYYYNCLNKIESQNFNEMYYMY